MRVELTKIDPKKTVVFTGCIAGIRYEKFYIRNVQIYDESGQNVIGVLHHVLTAKKPFKYCDVGDNVRFTGKVYKYHRSDGTEDYGIMVNKSRKLRKK